MRIILTIWPRDAGPDRDAATPNVGRSQLGPYLSSGANVRQVPKPAVVGGTEGSYNDKARPRSALKRLTKKEAKRLKRMLASYKEFEKQPAAG
jgi:hypothetical protein